MEVTRQESDDLLELKVKGRLHGYWSDHLAHELVEVVRDGSRQIVLDLADVTYVSSAGIRVMLQFYKQLAAIQESLTVSSPSEPVKRVLEIAGLEALLISQAKPSPIRENSWSVTMAPTVTSPGERERRRKSKKNRPKSRRSPLHPSPGR